MIALLLGTVRRLQLVQKPYILLRKLLVLMLIFRNPY
jgi:hypothetical protein